MITQRMGYKLTYARGCFNPWLVKYGHLIRPNWLDSVKPWFGNNPASLEHIIYKLCMHMTKVNGKKCLVWPQHNVFQCNLLHFINMPIFKFNEQILPNSPSWDSDSLNDAYHHLCHEYEKKCHEVKRAVCPARERTCRVSITH